ncbi:eukaryotic translation initiation factor 4 gamma 3 [Caerostris darwini]|uniref:Eukaryotic translation initiation factor 4 gamma 3 n=1 Tax=Caerostris darwini TaxID=1538125 RepID=A0AAV4MRY7_9ARAC|nr:eukaryotic translation initiation factor 4 gamma 3 [Caerostris darwini]
MDKKKGAKVEIDEEEEKKIRYRQLGNIRFIGELFKLSMLIEPITHECIKKLLIQGDDESLQCLCKLLKTIGKEIDHGKTVQSREESKMDVYFNEMKSIVDKRLTSSRVRFMLQDVIDLKKNNWIPRRDENNPKTIDQIYCLMKEIGGKTLVEWANLKMVGLPLSKSNKGSYSMVDPSKLRLTKSDEVESIRLGPGGRGLQSWGRGSSRGTKTSVDSDVKTTLTNRFNTLAETNVASNYEGRRGSQIAESEDLCLKGPEYNEDDMDKKTKPLIDEFLHNNDFEEAVKCVTELASSNTVHMFINAAINQVLERSSQARFSLGQLLYSLLKKKILTFDQYKKGFKGVLEIIDEYALDIPLIWDYMGEILEPMIEDTEFPLKLIKDVLKPCIPSQTAGRLVSAILHCAAKKKGTIKLGEVWRESGLQWSDFLGKDINIPEFIKKHKLKFTVKIFDWIDANVSDLTEPSFIRAFVTAVHESAILNDEGSYKLDQNKLKTMGTLLTHYIGRNEKLGLQALYAVQALMNELGHPSGLLHQIFDILYDDDVITEDTFKDWEQSDDPDEAEGKGVAIHSVKSFFMWLKEPEETEE